MKRKIDPRGPTVPKTDKFSDRRTLGRATENRPQDEKHSRDVEETPTNSGQFRPLFTKTIKSTPVLPAFYGN